MPTETFKQIKIGQQMYTAKTVIEEHFRETERLLRDIPDDAIAGWLLNEGYFPEPNIVPPSFKNENFTLNNEPYYKDVSRLPRKKLASISYPKSLLTKRIFSIQHPHNYHDIVFYLHKEWQSILNILFPDEIKIFSYSIPIPLDKANQGLIGGLRAGRMIYEWICMSEGDLVMDAVNYNFIAKTDITNFYASIYTHSIAWAIVGDREQAFADKNFDENGSKIDKLIQYSNDARTNGIPVGSALSDMIAEILLSKIDKEVSDELKDLDFLAVRFKDDYRILCKTEDDSKRILAALAGKLNEYNLKLNENKTKISALPDGLYRDHEREYFPYSLKDSRVVSFKIFENTLMIALDIHRKYPGTSLLEKFLTELLNVDKTIKIKFSQRENNKMRELIKFISLLFMVKRESEKTLSHVLSLVQLVYFLNKELRPKLKEFIRDIVLQELIAASAKDSDFEVIWYIFFWRSIGLGDKDFDSLIQNAAVKENLFVRSMIESKNKLYTDSYITLFRPPRVCKKQTLAAYLDAFNRNENQL